MILASAPVIIKT